MFVRNISFYSWRDVGLGERMKKIFWFFIDFKFINSFIFQLVELAESDSNSQSFTPDIRQVNQKYNLNKNFDKNYTERENSEIARRLLDSSYDLTLNSLLSMRHSTWSEVKTDPFHETSD